MIEPKYRTFWPRFWAGMVDGLVFLPLSFVDSWVYTGSKPVVLRASWFVFYSFAFIAYTVVMHGRFGQTLGKMVAGVKVLDVSETKLSFKQAALRESVPLVFSVIMVVLEWPTVLRGGRPLEPASLGPAFWLAAAGSVGWFLVELITMLTNEKRRALHDFIAGSVVVRVRAMGAGEGSRAAAV